MFSTTTTTEAVAAKRGILKRRAEGGPQVVKKRVTFADVQSAPPSPAPAPPVPSPVPTPSPKPKPSPTRGPRAAVASPVDTIMVDAPPLSPSPSPLSTPPASHSPVESPAVRAARVRERNSFWDEEIQRLKNRGLEEAEKEKAAAAVQSAAAAQPPAAVEPTLPAQPTQLTTTTPPPTVVPMTPKGRGNKIATAIHGFFASLLLAITTWWQAKIGGPFVRFLDDEKANEFLDDVFVFFGERAVFAFLVVFSLPLMMLVYSIKLGKWIGAWLGGAWLGGLDGLRSRISQGSHRRRDQLIGGESAGFHPGEDCRREPLPTCHIGMSARAGLEEYYGWVSRRR